MHPENGDLRSKSGTSDDSILLDHPIRSTILSGRLDWLLVNVRDPDAAVFDLSDVELLKQLMISRRRLSLADPVSFQVRHSGNPVDFHRQRTSR